MFVGMCNLAYGQPCACRPVEPATPSACQTNVQPLPKVLASGESVSLTRSYTPAPCATRSYTAVADPKSTGNRLQHLLQAANHLQAAGESQQAQRLRQLADREIQTLLNRLAALQAEVARFRQATGGRQQVLVQVKLLEISRSSLRKLGFDSAKFSELAGVGSDFRVFDDVKKLDASLEALRQDGLIRVLAEPTLVTLSGRPAAIHCGGEVPVPVSQAPGNVSIEHRKLGTEVDLLPIVLEGGRVRIEIRARHSELDPALNVRHGDRTVPGVRTCQIETAVEIQAGKTLVLGGLVARAAKKPECPKTNGQTTKPDPTDDKPKEVTEETKLLLLITPQIVEPAASSSAVLPLRRTTTK
jgi:Flp pilus assembly secretin CpaC